MKTRIFIVMAAVALFATACVKRTDNGEQARNDYAKSLQDSIESLKQEIDSCNSQITVLRDQVGSLMNDFITIANPREVGSYTLPKKFANLYPPKSTALVARIDDAGCFELVAALSGKAFDRITVQGPSVSASTDVVPYDRALNYRAAGLTTVLFSGAAADSVGMLISDNELNPLTVIYEQGGAVQSWKVPTEYANEVAQTWRLYQTQRDLNNMERRVPMLHEKINLIRIHMDKK